MQRSAKCESILKQNIHKNNSAIFITLDNLEKSNFNLYFETLSVYNQQLNFCSRHNTIFVTKFLRQMMSKLLLEITLKNTSKCMPYDSEIMKFNKFVENICDNRKYIEI